MGDFQVFCCIGFSMQIWGPGNKANVMSKACVLVSFPDSRSENESV